MFTKQSNKYLIQKNNNNNQIGQYPFALSLSLSLSNSKALILNQIHSDGWWVCFVFLIWEKQNRKKVFFFSQMPLITGHRSTHRRHSSPIASPPSSAPPTDSPPRVFFFFHFSFRYPLSSSAPLFLGHLHRRWFILLISVLDFFFLYCCMALSIWVFRWFMGHGWLGLWVVVDGWDVLWVLVVDELWVLGG